MKIMRTVLRCIGCILLACAVLTAVLLYKLSSIQVRGTKDYNEIYVKPTEVFDYSMMIEPPEEYSALYQIDLPMRKKVAEYMKEHSFKLRCGEQSFIRLDPTFDELINDCFKFEKITPQQNGED